MYIIIITFELAYLLLCIIIIIIIIIITDQITAGVNIAKRCIQWSVGLAQLTKISGTEYTGMLLSSTNEVSRFFTNTG